MRSYIQTAPWVARYAITACTRFAYHDHYVLSILTEEFGFYSKRHIGMPFGLSIYMDGLIDLRVSTCCEYRHKRGVQLGSKCSHFRLVNITGGKPCYRYYRSLSNFCLSSVRFVRALTIRFQNGNSNTHVNLLSFSFPCRCDEPRTVTFQRPTPTPPPVCQKTVFI